MPIHDLNELLQHAQPKLQPGAFVFVSLPDWPDLPLKDVLMSFQEDEGMTFILRQSVADQLGLQYEYVAAWITMEVNSALDAVGFTAAFATALGRHNISCNVVAAFHHDHLFVAKKDAALAMDVLQNL
ncbi:ACT domain-containing protein [Neolewinella aurantiaca]|uniref:ACT domain-containing protein n=1 Tax=Neolewinella aurantiaca TaxID=2602767 RepID=A0A5C7FGJ4_9BACT|nr:ACT domain-containing protein [Neolewinella aurantiaca]TXF90387.1 ACT domain-containing protein [Neolewinella aurantiaca]